MEETLLLPQWAASKQQEHIEQFQRGMEQVRSIMEIFATWANRVYKALRSVTDPIAKILLETFVPLLKRTSYSSQTRHYLAVKRREIARRRS